jgi:hypothetical protein
MHNLFGNQNVDKIIALTILALLLVISYLLFSNLYLSGLSELKSEIELSRKKTGKVDGILANEKKYQQEINKIKSEYKQSRNFLNSNQPSTASSEVQNKIKRIINSTSRAKIISLKPFPVIQHEGYSEVSVEIRMKDIGHKEIRKMLYAIESQLPLIIIKELDITRTQYSYKSILGAAAKDKNDLNVTLVASGFFRGARNQ